MQNQNRTPFGFLKWTPLVLLIGVLYEILAPAIKAIGNILPILMVIGVITIIIIALRFTGGQASKLFQLEIVKKLFSGLVIAGVLLAAGYLIHYLVINHLVAAWGMPVREALVMLAIIAPFILAGFWILFGKILPGSSGAIFFGQAFISAAVIVLVLFTYQKHPYEFFDHKTGKVKAWVSDSEKQVYSSPGYGLKDGKPLRPMTAEDAKIYGTEKMSQKGTVKNPSAVQRRWRISWINPKTGQPMDFPIALKVCNEQFLIFTYNAGAGGIFSGERKGNGYSGTWKEAWPHLSGQAYFKFESPQKAEGWHMFKGIKCPTALYAVN